MIYKNGLINIFMAADFKTKENAFTRITFYLQVYQRLTNAYVGKLLKSALIDTQVSILIIFCLF